MGKDSRIYSDRRSAGSTTSQDHQRIYHSPSPSPETRIVATTGENGATIQIPPGAIATTKHEEWTTKKKVQQVVTKEVETRVQRQLVTEDGRVVEDSGPQITQQTREEKKINEEEDTQHKTPTIQALEGYTAIPGATVISTKTESREKSHEVKEDHKETHDEQLEEISGEEFHRRAIMDNDGSTALVRRSGTPSTTFSSTGPRIVNQYTKRHKVTDRDDVHEISREKDGEITTERTVTHQSEEEADDEVPDEEDPYQYEGERKMISYPSESVHSDHRYKEQSNRENEEYEQHKHRSRHSSSRRVEDGEYEHKKHRSRHGSSRRREKNEEYGHQHHIERESSSKKKEEEYEHDRNRKRHGSSRKSSHKDRRDRYQESSRERNDHSEQYSRRSEHDHHKSHRHKERRHEHQDRSISPDYRESSRGIVRTGTMRSNASSQTATPKSHYYMGDYDNSRTEQSGYHDKRPQDDFSSLRRHESFHHEARSSYTPHSNSGRSNLHRTGSQRSVATSTEDYPELKHASSTMDKMYGDRNYDRSPSPAGNRSPSRKYYLGEDPWRKESHHNERNYSRSNDLRREVATRSYEKQRRDYSPQPKYDDQNRKDLYSWEDHRSRDYYSHSTKLSDEERDGHLSRSSRHHSGSHYDENRRGDRVKSYSLSPVRDYGPTYSVSAHSRSEDTEKDPNDPHRQVHRTNSQTQSEDVRTVPVHDGGKKVTVSKVRQNHYRSEMKYDEGGIGTSPPTSPPPHYGYDAVDSNSIGRRSNYSETRGSYEDVSRSRASRRGYHDNDSAMSEKREERRYKNIQEEHSLNGYHDDLRGSGSHYKSAIDRQRYVPRPLTPPESPIYKETVSISPDYMSRPKMRPYSPDDPVLSPPSFTPLQSPLSVKTADETKTNRYESKRLFDSDEEQNKNSKPYSSLSTSEKGGPRTYQFSDSYERNKEIEEDRENYNKRFSSFDRSRDPTPDNSLIGSSFKPLQKIQQDLFTKDLETSEKLSDRRRESPGPESFNSFNYDRGTSKSWNSQENRTTSKEVYGTDSSNLGKSKYLSKIEDDQSKSYLKNDRTETKLSSEKLEPLKKLDPFTKLYSKDDLSKEYSKNESLSKSSIENQSYNQNTFSKKESHKDKSMEADQRSYSQNTFSRKEPSIQKKTFSYEGKEGVKKQDTRYQSNFTESIALPDLTSSPDYQSRDDKDTDSVKSDKSRTSTRTFILEESNTNSLKKVHLNPTFRNEVSPPSGLNKKPVRTIKEDVPLEPMKQIPKPNKKAPVAVPPRPSRSSVISTSPERKKWSKPTAPRSSSPKKASKSQETARSPKKPGLVEVRGWENR